MATCTGRSSPEITQTVEVPIATAKALTDFVAVGIASNTLKLPSDQAWVTDEATTRTNFVTDFVGVNQQLKAANVARIPGNSKDNICVVNNIGVYDVVVESATFQIGDLIGPSKDTGNALKDTSFKKVTAIAEACFQVVETYTSAVTLVRARILSNKARASR